MARSPPTDRPSARPTQEQNGTDQRIPGGGGRTRTTHVLLQGLKRSREKRVVGVGHRDRPAAKTTLRCFQVRHRRRVTVHAHRMAVPHLEKTHNHSRRSVPVQAAAGRRAHVKKVRRRRRRYPALAAPRCPIASKSERSVQRASRPVTGSELPIWQRPGRSSHKSDVHPCGTRAPAAERTAWRAGSRISSVRGGGRESPAGRRPPAAGSLLRDRDDRRRGSRGRRRA